MGKLRSTEAVCLVQVALLNEVAAGSQQVAFFAVLSHVSCLPYTTKRRWRMFLRQKKNKKTEEKKNLKAVYTCCFFNSFWLCNSDPGFIAAQPTMGTKWPALKGSADKWLFVTLVGARNAASYQKKKKGKVKCLLDNSLNSLYLLRITLPLSSSSTPSPQPTAGLAAEIHHLVSWRLTKCGRQWSAVYRAGQTHWAMSGVPPQRLRSHL